LSFLSVSGTPLRIQFFHIPGHTPDSLAWYDLDEHYLYVGDTFYERKSRAATRLANKAVSSGLPLEGAIILPDEGANMIQLIESLYRMIHFVFFQNDELQRRHRLIPDQPLERVKVACGHISCGLDAEVMIVEVSYLFEKIISGRLPALGSLEKRGKIYDFWLESPESRYSVLAPRRLVEDARKHYYPESLPFQTPSVDLEHATFPFVKFLQH